MAKMIIKAYDTVIENDWYEGGADVLIGVVQGEHPDEAYWDCWADEKIYFYLDPEEFDALKVGDVLNDGEDFTVVEIDKDNPRIFEIEYNEEDFQDA